MAASLRLRSRYGRANLAPVRPEAPTTGARRPNRVPWQLGAEPECISAVDHGLDIALDDVHPAI